MKRLTAAIVIMLTLALCACGPVYPDQPVVVIGGDDNNTQGTEGTDTPSVSGIVINELMADNNRFVLACMDDWVELFNEGDSDAQLAGWCLMKKGSDKVVPLDQYTVKAKDYAVIKLTEASPFRLSKEGETLVLIRGTEVMDELTFDASIGKASFSHDGVCEYPTPGFPNTEAGYEAYLESMPLPGLRINEVVSSNSKYMPVDDKFYDFVEIYNGTGQTLNLSDYYLSDKKSEPYRYHFPEKTLEPDGYFIVYCSGLSSENQAPFKISSQGETLYLSDKNGFIDAVYVPGDVKKDESYGRNGNRWVYIPEVTPLKPNAVGHVSNLAAPTASIPSGSYDSELTVELSGEGTIYYTLDGTEPTTKSRIYTEPIRVNHIASIRTFCSDGERSSALTSYFYLVNVEHTFPVLNVAIKQDYLTGDKGVLNHVDPEYEHEAYITLMDGGVECFSVPCGFKLHGNDSKKGAKQNFQLRFRSSYGMSKLKYKVFEDRDITTFNSLILKGGSEDFPYCNFRDELCTSLVDGTTNLSTQAYRPVILYLNGEYWGVYWLRERIDAEYCAQRLGVSDESINLTKDYGELVVKGSAKTFTELINYCKSHDLRNQSDYDYVMDRIDYMSLVDWYICRSYFADTDLANGRFYSSEEADGRWHWCFFDLDWAMWNNSDDPIGHTAKDDGNHVIIRALLKNSDFKDMFLKRYAYLMKTVLNEQNIIKKIDEFTELMRPEMERDRIKYGFSMTSWENNILRLKSFVENGNRDSVVLKGIKSWFSLSNDQMMSYFGRTS